MSMQPDELKGALLESVALALDSAKEVEPPELSSWFHRPFTAEEIDAHPDGERIWASLEALREDILATVRGNLIVDIKELFANQPRKPFD